MKVGKILLVLLFAAITSYAQNKSLGVGTPTPNANAALHVESPTNNQGFIMPRLTTAQRTGLSTLLTATDNGLMLYDTNLKTIFIWDGTAWKNTAEVAGGSRLSYPYKDSVATSLTGNDLFALKYNNASTKRVLRVESLNSANAGSAVSVLQNGTGIGIFSRVDNATAGTSAIFGTTNSNLGGAVAPVGVYGESTGTGSLAASFRVNNAANNFPAVYAETNGIGSAARLVSLNAASTAPALVVVNAGTGSAIQTTGKIQAGEFIGNGSGLTNVKSIGLSYPFKDSVSTTLTGNDVFALKYNNAANKRVLRVESLSPTNGSSAVSVLQNGTGIGIFSRIDNAAAGTSAIYGTTNSNLGGALAPVGVYGESTGTGSTAGSFRITNAANTFSALYSETNGTGPTFTARQIGAGNASAGSFRVTGATNTGAAIYSQTDGTGAAIQGQTSTGFTAVYGRREGATNGNAGFFEIADAGNASPALQSRTVGTGSAAFFENLNAAGTGPNVQSSTNSPGGAFRGTSTGLGYGGWFEITNSGNGQNALLAETSGTGSSIFANHTGAVGNIAIFQSASINVARIDKKGQGFFNGGTQNSGADVAEMFDVEGSKSQYEPGDVLVISEANDRTVEKSSAPASTKVVGVYATKPGVVLTEKSIEESLDQLVPMGVIGVIPTKVCLENGPIKRGDLLVTSSKQGHAMKAIPVNVGGVLIYPTGAILGKALENFDGQESGLIKVLVNVK
jgi:hypothetical protein